MHILIHRLQLAHNFDKSIEPFLVALFVDSLLNKLISAHILLFYLALLDRSQPLQALAHSLLLAQHLRQFYLQSYDLPHIHLMLTVWSALHIATRLVTFILLAILGF